MTTEETENQGRTRLPLIPLPPGVTKWQSSRWQQLARLDEADLEALIKDYLDQEEELSTHRRFCPVSSCLTRKYAEEHTDSYWFSIDIATRG